MNAEPKVPAAVVFLDFDGVLNHGEWYRSRGPSPRPPRSEGDWLSTPLDLTTEPAARWCFDPSTALRLNRLADAGAAFVISSTWRIGADLDNLRAILHALGFRGEAIGATPDLTARPPGTLLFAGKIRGDEIQAWLDEHVDAALAVLSEQGAVRARGGLV